MQTMSTIYNETSVRPERIKYSPDAIKKVIVNHVTVKECSLGVKGELTFIVEGDIDGAVRALKEKGFNKPVRIKTDGSTSITLIAA